jgi:hypothetical protein
MESGLEMVDTSSKPQQQDNSKKKTLSLQAKENSMLRTGCNFHSQAASDGWGNVNETAVLWQMTSESYSDFWTDRQNFFFVSFLKGFRKESGRHSGIIPYNIVLYGGRTIAGSTFVLTESHQQLSSPNPTN